ncbi:MAG: hypothetical protein ABIR54_09515 [Burkholderiaceae bacterium]
MRAPPPVEYTSALGRAWRVALSLLIGASVAVPLAWGLPYFAAHWGSRQPDALFEALGNPLVQAALALWAASMVVAASWLARRATAAGEHTLRWDGQDWLLAGDGRGRPDQRGDAALMLDLGPWMLVRFLPCASLGFGAGVWLPLTVAGDLARWAALRGALWNWRVGRGNARS